MDGRLLLNNERIATENTRQSLNPATLEILGDYCLADSGLCARSIEAAKVRDAVFGGEFKGTIMGDVKYNEKGLAFMPFLALQWWDGKRMPVYPPMEDVWKLKMRPTN